MKISLIVTSLIFFNSLISVGQDIEPAPDDKTVVYFMNIPGFSTASISDIYYFDNETFIGICKGKNYFRYECEPGEHVFSVRERYPDFIEADIEAGKIYFIQVSVSGGAYGILYPVDPRKPKSMKKILKLINKEPPKSFYAEDFEVENLNQILKEITDEYMEFKVNGKKILTLEKTMYYKEDNVVQ